MTHTQRLKAVVAGQKTDRPAFAAWGPHMNLTDRNVKDFVKETCDYQNAHDFDFIKVMPNGIYFPEAFGQTFRAPEHILDEVYLATDKNAVNDPHEWSKLKVPSFTEGAFAREIEAVKRINDYYQGDVPVLPTVFSPVFWMREMAGGPTCNHVIKAHFENSEKDAMEGIKIVAETNDRLIEEYIKAGAAGFFYAVQCGFVGMLGKDLFEGVVKKYDVQNLKVAEGKTWFNMAHLCDGDREHTKWFLDYPVDAFNWADQVDHEFSMEEMRGMTDKVLVGGLLHSTGSTRHNLYKQVLSESDLSGYNRDEIKARIKQKSLAAIKAAGPKVVVSGGCGWGIGSLPRFGLWKEVMEEIGQEMA